MVLVNYDEIIGYRFEDGGNCCLACAEAMGIEPTEMNQGIILTIDDRPDEGYLFCDNFDGIQTCGKQL